MEHIDEGTIHAWLDDALPADEGARIEAHAASCATCAAAIAEARGLIAASSRILATLDDVPSGVMPKRAGAETTRARPAGPPTTPSLPLEPSAPATLRRARRAWWQRPQLVAAAGMAFVAVALSVIWQRSSRTSIAELASDAASEPAIAPAAQPTVSPSAAPSATPSATPSAAPVAVSAAGRAAAAENAPRATSDTTPTGVLSAARQNVAPVARRAPGATAEGVAAASAEEAATPRDAGARRDRAGRDLAAQSPEAKRVDAPRPVPAVVGTSTTAAKTRIANEMDPTLGVTQAGAPRGAGGAGVADSMAKKAAPVLMADAIVRREEERVRGEVDVARRSTSPPIPAPAAASASPASQAPATRGAAKSMVSSSLDRATPGVAPTPATLAGCYQLQLTTAARAAGLSAAIQLLASGAGEDETRPAYAVRPPTPATDAAKTAAAANAAKEVAMWRWTVVPNGVALVKGGGSGASRFVMAVGSGDARTRPEGTLAATRVDCANR
ncbi:MAG: zf-HC2 domain-containing protein [Gemmatimonadaceae bacterium]